MRYGGTVAVDHVSLTVTPGEDHRTDRTQRRRQDVADRRGHRVDRRPQGRIDLDGVDLSRPVGGAPGPRRASPDRSSRSSCSRTRRCSTTSASRPTRRTSAPTSSTSCARSTRRCRAEVVRAIKEFRLDDDLDRLVRDLPYGKRRLLAIARAVAMHPSVILLDEPAAGLGDAETAELARRRASARRRVGDGRAGHRARHELRDGALRRPRRPRLRPAHRRRARPSRSAPIRR